MKRTKDLCDNEEEEILQQQPNKNVASVKLIFFMVKLTKKALKLGAESLDYSKRKCNKYVITLKDGKKINFGSVKYEEFLIHGDKERRKNYLARAKKIKNKTKELTWKIQNRLMTGACIFFGEYVK